MLKIILKITCIISYLSALCITAPAYAAHPLATDDAVTTGMMKFQLETSAEFGWDKESFNGATIGTDSQVLNVVITAGVAEQLDLILTLPFSWQQVTENGLKINDSGGLNDLSLALKWRFLELGPASLAIKPAVTFPSGDYNRGLGVARPAYGATLISTVEFRPVAIHANIGYTHQNYTDADRYANRENLWNLSLASAVEVMKGLLAVAEIGTATNGNKAGTTWPTFLTGGVIYSVIENLDLSLGVKGGLTSPATDIALLTGLTCKFP